MVFLVVEAEKQISSKYLRQHNCRQKVSCKALPSDLPQSQGDERVGGWEVRSRFVVTASNALYQTCNIRRFQKNQHQRCWYRKLDQTSFSARQLRACSSAGLTLGIYETDLDEVQPYSAVRMRLSSYILLWSDVRRLLVWLS